jgi:circadian clock protein KaiC
MSSDVAVRDLGLTRTRALTRVELPKARTGIKGLDEITGGGLPLDRTTLVAGAAGTGKTLLGLQFLVSGAREFDDPGMLVTFEESAAKVSANVSSFGFDLGGLQRDGMLAIHAFRVDPSEIIASGDFDFEPLFLLLDDTIARLGVKRVVLDTIEVLFGAFQNAAIVRAELSRLFRWLEDRGVTAIVTAEQGASGLTRQGIEEYVSDCVIVLDHRVRDEISTRRLRVVKYRGSRHGTNEYPFLISTHGLVVLPVTSIYLDYGASDERVSTGVQRLDHMLAGGLFRGSTALVSGMAGTGKSTLGATFVDSACGRAEHALLVLLEESPAQFIRNMRSIGLDLQHWVDDGLLYVWAARPGAVGLENLLAMLVDLLDEVKPTVAVLDGIASLGGGQASEISSMVNRQLDLLKSRAITTLATTLDDDERSSAVGMSSVVDAWVQLRNVESNGERNRLLSVIKCRGTAHSNQVREFVITDRGVDLIDVYVGPDGFVTGSAREAQGARQRDAAMKRDEDFVIRRGELLRSIVDGEGQLTVLGDEIALARAEMMRIDAQEERELTYTESDRVASASRRWADKAPAEGSDKR